jgi:ATP-binding cassette subfamily B protein
MRNPFPSELLWLYQRVRPLFAWHLASFLCVLAGSVLALLNPLILMRVIDHVLPARDIQLLVCMAALTFLSYESRVVLTNLGGYLTLRAAQRSALSMRMEILHRLDSLSADYHENISIGAKLYTLQEPVDEIAYFGSDLLPAILRTLLATAFTLFAMFVLNPRLTLLVLPAIPAFLVARTHFRRLLSERSDRVQSDRASVSAFLQEHLSSILQIQSLRQEKRQEKRAFCSLARVVRSQTRQGSAGIHFAIWTSLPIGAAAASLLGFGAWAVLRGAMTVGGLVALHSYIFQLFDPLTGALEMYARSQRTFSSIRQIQETLSLQSTLEDAGTTIAIPRIVSSQIRFHEVAFGYRRQKCFLTIPNLAIDPAEHVAIVGENGSGKSTFAKLLARFYDPSRGFISIGGCQVGRLPLNQFRALVCYVPAAPILFDDTLAGNLRLGNPSAGAQEIEEVIELVGLTPFVRSLPHGTAERLGPAGNLLSGGQRQSLALARALLLRPQVLILDEATSALDLRAELQVLHGICRFLQKVTLLFVSHRLANSDLMDRVLVFHLGTIVEDGSPVVLSRAGSIYTELLRTSQSADSLYLS